MTEAASLPRRVSWYRPGIADVLFLIITLAVVRTSQGSLLDDPGVGWHLRNIDAMFAQGSWLTEDPFTDPRTRDTPTMPWYTNQWFGDLTLYLGWKWAGLEGITVVCALIMGWLGRSIYLCLLDDGLAWPIAFLWACLGMMGSSISWVARPNLFTLVFIFFTARACIRLHEGTLSRSQCVWLTVMFAFWANTHGGFLAGLITLGATCGIELVLALLGIEGARRRIQAVLGLSAIAALLATLAVLGIAGEYFRLLAPIAVLNIGGVYFRLLAALGFGVAVVLITLLNPCRRVLTALGLSAAAVLATLLNPYGIKLYSWVFLLLGEPYLMDLHMEWLSPNLHDEGSMRYEALLLLFPLILGLSSRRPSVVEMALSILWLHFALNGIRYMALWVLIVTPILARASIQIPFLQDLAQKLELSGDPVSIFSPRVGRGGWLATVVVALALVVWSHVDQGNFAAHRQKSLPSESLDEFLRIATDWQERHPGQQPKLFHCYNWGGYLTWKGWPVFHNWIDDRNEAQGIPRIKLYFHINGGETRWQDEGRETGWKDQLAQIDLVCIEPDAGLVERLANDASTWKEVYRDKFVVVFERR